MRCLILTKLECNLFLPSHASPLAISTTIEEGKHHLQCKNGVTDFKVPLQQMSEELDLCSFNVALATEESVYESLDKSEEKLDGVIIKGNRRRGQVASGKAAQD